MAIHRRRGRPRLGEDASTHRVTLRVPLPLWEQIECLAKADGLTHHAWMRQALEAVTSSRLPAVPDPSPDQP